MENFASVIDSEKILNTRSNVRDDVCRLNFHVDGNCQSSKVLSACRGAVY